MVSCGASCRYQSLCVGRLKLGGSNGELDGVLTGVASVEDIDNLATVQRIRFGSAGVEGGGSIRGEGDNRAISVEAETSRVTVKRRGRVVQNLELACLNVGKQLSRLLALREDIDHGVSNGVSLEEGEALSETVDDVVSSDLKRLHANDTGAREHTESVLGGARLFHGRLLADNGGSQSGSGSSENGEGLEEHVD